MPIPRADQSIHSKKEIPMSNRESVAFRVRAKGGLSGGKTLAHDVPAFDFESFIKTPNGDEFIKMAYFSAVKKIIREIAEEKNGSVASDLESFESVIARSLVFTKEEILEWINTRDWQQANVKDIGKLLPQIEKRLPSLATRKHSFTEKQAKELADKVVAAVADKPTDSIADFLFTTLTTPRDLTIDYLSLL